MAAHRRKSVAVKHCFHAVRVRHRRDVELHEIIATLGNCSQLLIQWRKVSRCKKLEPKPPEKIVAAVSESCPPLVRDRVEKNNQGNGDHRSPASCGARLHSWARGCL